MNKFVDQNTSSLMDDFETSYPHSLAFELIAPHYDTLMRTVPYDSWMRYLLELLDLRGHKPKRVLDLACGTGNITELLLKEIPFVAGVDISEGMIAQAKAKAVKKRLAIPYFNQDAAKMQLDTEPFDLVVSFFDSLNYIVSPAQLQDAMCAVHKHLAPGGLFIFDVNSAFALQNCFFDQDNMHSRKKLRYSWKSAYNPETRLATIRMRFFVHGTQGIDEEFRETHVQFAYTEDELTNMLKVAGFEEIQLFQAYTVKPVRPTSDRIHFVAARPIKPTQ